MMGLTVKDSGGSDLEIIPAGGHHAICYGVVDLGSQWDKNWDKWKDKLMIFWELPEVRMATDKGEMPRVINNRYTASLHDKSILTQHLESWRGKKFTEQEKAGFYVGDLLGINCVLNIIHNSSGGKTYANVASIIPLMAGMIKKSPENPLLNYDMDKHGLEIPEGMYDWVTKIIKESKQHGGSVAQPDEPEDEPFTQTEPPTPGDDNIPY